jgi:hypothetical protein
VVASAPRIDSRLIAALERLDDGATPIAETYRRVAVVARALGFARSSYEQVRTLIHDARRRGRRPTTGDILLDVAFRTRPPVAGGEHLAGTLPPAPRGK